ncbi:TIGR04211 family SH3 domain-containing protein [Pasteurella skyensis]|uniref:TIGR04211 family SH3 domain-containing protein n=1 Tax=Phocoenobacter skyensis TaxID=97481 RepID=A0AAJ6NA85_9PAST|nr:TIGR04211 family SH3 domain-containing protein [Pasteurella skyensis]MDP8163104.1 TIGR04211 family SH3 domain-containing protein [Pasteurella skyensis]MDP8170192.1 TIGR04211 family SH3 domain-containing protein [Pasteurella skyensis]MDP8173075.1 TIGR04211 family SH3 domain-containing protein [Pasteurella skyensis]MDP8174447.1 TIGR04211 family SH3 domain-containing protein [Pasteurella skyensis]MDP8177173.1 TIGR04211 family SH3 domain-containing protein [Pasteurella skyensis]
MKSKIIQLISISLLGIGIPLSGYAEKHYYVTDNLSEYVRKGAGDNYRIAGTVKAGEKVIVLEKKNKYSLIQDSRNHKVWILSDRLTDKPSAREQLPFLEKQVEELKLKLSKINGDWQRRTEEIRRRSTQVEQQSSALLDINAQLKQEVNVLKNKNKELEIMQDVEQREIMIQWFMYGGLVLGIGLLLGLLLPFILPRKKQNSGWS